MIQQDFEWRFNPLYKEPKSVENMSQFIKELVSTEEHVIRPTPVIGLHKSHSLRDCYGMEHPPHMRIREKNNRRQTALDSSPRTIARRKREMELEAKQLGYVASNSSSDSSDEAQDSDGRHRLRKANSSSPGHAQEKGKRPSYKQYLREKRSRSRDKGASGKESQSSEHRISPEDDSKSVSQVHWKVHKMPLGGGPAVETAEVAPVSPSSPSWQEKASAYWAKGKTSSQSAREIFDTTFDYTFNTAVAPAHLATPLTSRKQYFNTNDPVSASDKAVMRRSWLNSSSHQLNGSYDSHLKNDGCISRPPVSGHQCRALEEQPPLSLLSQSVHDALMQHNRHPSRPPVQFSSQNLPEPRFERQNTFSGIVLDRTDNRDVRLRSVGPAGRSSEESSPLDSIPVRDSSIPERDRAPVQLVPRSVLSVSENSAFRPIQPAPSQQPDSPDNPYLLHKRTPPAQSSAIHMLATAAGVDDEPIYVSVNQVTQHPAKHIPPRIRTRSEETERKPLAVVTVLPVHMQSTMPATVHPVQDLPSVTQHISQPVISQPNQPAEDKAHKVGQSQSTFAVKGSLQLKVDSKADEASNETVKPVLITPFVARPPPSETPAESNLERWKARKRNMQAAKSVELSKSESLEEGTTAPVQAETPQDKSEGSQQTDAVPFLGTKINRAMLEHSHITIQDVSHKQRLVSAAQVRHNGVTQSAKSIKTYQTAGVQTETSKTSCSSRNSNTSTSSKGKGPANVVVSESDHVATTSESPLTAAVAVLEQKDEQTTPTQHTLPDTADHLTEHSQKGDMLEYSTSGGTLVGRQPQPTHIHDHRSQIMGGSRGVGDSGIGAISPHKSPSRSPFSGSEASRTWFVNPGRLDHAYSTEAAAAALWKQRERLQPQSAIAHTQPPSRSPRSSDKYHLSAQFDPYEKAVLTAPPRISSNYTDAAWPQVPRQRQHSPPNRDKYLQSRYNQVFAPISSSSLHPAGHSSSTPRISLTPAQQHLLQQRSSHQDLMQQQAQHRKPALLNQANNRMESLRPMPEFVNQNEPPADSISPILNRTNVSSKARLFETMAQHQEDEKKKLYTTPTQSGVFSPTQQQPQQYYQPPDELQQLRLSPGRKSTINRAQTYHLTDFKSRSPEKQHESNQYPYSSLQQRPLQQISPPKHQRFSPPKTIDTSKPVVSAYQDFRPSQTRDMNENLMYLVSHSPTTVLASPPMLTQNKAIPGPVVTSSMASSYVLAPVPQITTAAGLAQQKQQPMQPLQQRSMALSAVMQPTQHHQQPATFHKQPLLPTTDDLTVFAKMRDISNNNSVTPRTTATSITQPSTISVVDLVPLVTKQQQQPTQHQTVLQQSQQQPIQKLQQQPIEQHQQQLIHQHHQHPIQQQQQHPIQQQQQHPIQQQQQHPIQQQQQHPMQQQKQPISREQLQPPPASNVEKSIFSRMKEMVLPRKEKEVKSTAEIKFEPIAKIEAPVAEPIRAATPPAVPTFSADPAYNEPKQQKLVLTESPMETASIVPQKEEESETEDDRSLEKTPPKDEKAALDDENDQSRLSVGQKTKLFEKKIKDQRKKKRREASRYQTQPVTMEEMAAVVGAMRQSAKGGTPPAPVNKIITTPSPAIIRPSTWRSAAEVQKPAGFTAPAPIPKTIIPEGYQKVIGTVKARKVVHLHTDGQSQERPSSASPATPAAGDCGTTEEETEAETQRPSRYANRTQGDRGSRFSRSHTVPIPAPPTEEMIASEIAPTGSPSIAERMAALKRSGEIDWKTRVPEESAIEIVQRRQHIVQQVEKQRSSPPPVQLEAERSLLDRKSALANAQASWQARVESKDQQALTISGKLEKAGLLISLAAPKAPVTNGVHTANITTNKTTSTKQASPVQNKTGSSDKSELKMVPLPSLDEGFSEFYRNPTVDTSSTSTKIDASAFDELTAATASSKKLVGVKGVRPPRRKSQPAGSSNPLKALSQRTDLIQSQYTDKCHKSPLAAVMDFKSQHRLGDIHRRPVSIAFDPLMKPGDRSSQLADAALHALAAKEDISAVKLRKADSPSSPAQSAQHKPHAPKMLVQLKGRKHVYLRLVNPVFESLNSGDCFLYLCQQSDTIFLYDGQFSNVLEKARAKETGHFIVECHDLGCATARTLTEIDTSFDYNNGYTSSEQKLLSLLGQNTVNKDVQICGDPDEDTEFESCWCSAIHIYSVISSDNSLQLVRLTDLEGQPLRRRMLAENEIYVFDFGPEVYVWTGRSVAVDKKRAAVQFAKSALYEKPFQPHTTAIDLFSAKFKQLESLDPQPRPQWTIFGHMRDKMETCLFREKFVDWLECSPSMIRANLESKLIKRLSSKSPTSTTGPFQFVSKRQALQFKDQSAVNMEAEDLALDMLSRHRPEPDLVIDDQSLGRGRQAQHHLDPLLGMHTISSEHVDMWHVKGVTECPQPVPQSSFGQFNESQCYIIKWAYRVSAAEAKSLKGGESKYNDRETGRKRAAFFYWQGKKTTASEQGACALAVRDMDVDRNPHIRVVEGKEPPAFLNLFQGTMVIHQQEHESPKTWRLFLLRGGPHKCEASLVQVDPDPNVSLRPHGSFILINPQRSKVICLQTPQSKSQEILKFAAEKIKEHCAPEFGFADKCVDIVHCNMQDDLVQPWLQEYAMKPTDLAPLAAYDSSVTARMFRLQCTGGNNFGCKEVESVCYDASQTQPFAFTQDQLYDVSHSQPYCVLIDVGSKLWLWQGWIPAATDSDSENELEDKAATEKLRVARVFAVKCCIFYAQHKRRTDSKRVPSSLVYAGLEPSTFTHLFPTWTIGPDQKEAYKFNQSFGRCAKTEVDVGELFDQFSQTEFAIDVLRRRPLPECVESSCMEQYLSDADFHAVFNMSKTTFNEIAAWKQIRLKQEAGLY